MTERYFDDDGEGPLSDFADDQGETFYDHDFLESGFRLSRSDAEILRGHSFSNSYVARVEQAMQSHGMTDANSVILVWRGEIGTPRSVAGSDYKLTFLGTFSCDPSAPEVT